MTRWQQTLSLLAGDPVPLPAVISTRVHRSADPAELADEAAEARAIRAAAKARRKAATTTCPADAGQAHTTTEEPATMTPENTFLCAAAPLLQQDLDSLRADEPEAAQVVARAIRAGGMARISATLSPSTASAWLRCELVLPVGEVIQLSQAEMQREVRQ